MSEKQKMLSGLLYDANYDEELIESRKKCKDLCFQFNKVKPSNVKKQNRLIKLIVGKTKNNFVVTAPFWCDYGKNIELGENFYSNHNLTILDGAKVVFGDNVFVAPNCVFSTAGHPVDFERRNKGLEFARPIIVGDNVWIGASVTVLPGVKIGNGSVIGAGSVVNKDVPDNVVAVGNPCRVIREIADADKKKYL